MSQRLPIVSVVIISNKNKCPTSYVPILKTFDDNSDADVYKEFAIWAKNSRYLAISRTFYDAAKLEVITDLTITEERQAIPANFVSVDFTADSNEKALRKKFLCVRFTPRNDALDAITDIIVINKSKRPPKGYISAGQVDGFVICYKVDTIPENYAKPYRSQSISESSYPPIPHRSFTTSVYRHSTTDIEAFEVSKEFSNLSVRKKEVRGIDGVPFKLRNDLEKSSNGREFHKLPKLVDPPSSLNLDYSFAIEKQFLSQVSM